jgi:hypothetical protein
MVIEYSGPNEVLMDMSINDMSDLIALSNGLPEIKIIAIYNTKIEVEVWMGGEIEYTL